MEFKHASNEGQTNARIINKMQFKSNIYQSIISISDLPYLHLNSIYQGPSPHWAESMWHPPRLYYILYFIRYMLYFYVIALFIYAAIVVISTNPASVLMPTWEALNKTYMLLILIILTIIKVTRCRLHRMTRIPNTISDCTLQSYMRLAQAKCK